MTPEEWRHQIETLQQQADAPASQERLVGKPFALFVPREARRAWRTWLATLTTGPYRQTWQGRLQPRHQPAFAAELTVVVLPAPQSEPRRLFWLLHDLRERLQAEAALRDAHEALEERVRERTAALVVETPR